MSQVDIGNVVRVSVLSALRGLANVNTSALALITDEAPIPADFGTARQYLNAQAVAVDFGSNSETYRIAEIVFSQNPNILSGRGYLVVIPREQTAAAQPATIIGSATVNLTALTATDYNLNAAVDGGLAADLLIGTIDSSSLAAAETSLNSTAVTSAGLVFTVSGQDPASALVTLKTVATGAATDITIGTATTGTDIAPLINISGSASGADAGVERVKDAVLRTNGAVPYFGIILNEKQTDAVLEELAATIQALDKILFVGSHLSADITGVFTDILDAGFTHTRCLFYSTAVNDALDFAAAYASRGLSVNYDAADTQLTMHLKDLTGLVADPGVIQSVLDAAGRAGVDVYADFGVAKVFTSGANQFFDQVYSRLALKLRIQVAGFNYLAQTNTKIPQTEEGMNGLKSACRAVMALFVANGTYAPGTWNSSTTFGDPSDHRRNIAEFGYFIYSIPIAQQAQAEREARIAPLIQIAAKEAGAIHSSDVTVLVEA
jgi:hypothetical protein